MPRIEPTEEQLREGWLAERRPSWPETFEEAMQDPLRSRLIHLAAARLANGPLTTPPATAERPVEHRGIYLPPPIPQSPASLDRKRAAAGEKDDD